MKAAKLSIVIAAFNGPSYLEQTLNSLVRRDDVQVIVVSNYDEGGESLIEGNYPHVNCFCMPRETTVPELRAKGIQHSTGEIVALVEDHCLFNKDWCEQIISAHDSHHQVVGGSIENAGPGLLDWAIYFHDYGKYMPPNRAGTIDSLSGLNISYKRAVLDKYKHTYNIGFFETFVNMELANNGVKLYLAPDAIVYHNKSYRLHEAVVKCYHSGRSFGGMRVSGKTPLVRLKFILGSFILPFLLPARILLTVMAKKRHLKELFFCFPHIVLLMLCWSYGEFCGYLSGEGTSSTRWT